MKKQLIIAVIFGIFLLTLLLIIKPSLTGFAVYSEDSIEKIKLGYCLTMQEEAISLSEKENYELIKFGSASEVLFALKNNKIDKGLIGRKAKLSEINKNTKETILKSGYTLVSSQGGFIEYSDLHKIGIHTYLPKEKAEILIPENKNIIYYKSKQEAINKISERKAVLISWEDWQDDFELIVVMNGNEKVKDFRGVFLYEN